VVQIEPDFNNWQAVKEEEIGGAGEIRIVRFSVTKNGETISTIEKGDRVSIRLLIESSASKSNVILGYTIKDRVGKRFSGRTAFA